MSDDQALALRRQHVTYREIACQLGLSGPSRAYAAVQRAIAAEPFDDVEAVRRDIAEQLDEALSVARSIITGSAAPARRKTPNGARRRATRTAGEGERALRALDTYARLLDRKAKLFGADLPVPRYVEVEVLTDEVFKRHRERLAEKLIASGVNVEVLEAFEQDAEGRLEAILARTQPELLTGAPDTPEDGGDDDDGE